MKGGYIYYGDLGMDGMRTNEKAEMAERAGFEPAVHLLSVRAFSKRLVSATHPPFRTKIGSAF